MYTLRRARPRARRAALLAAALLAAAAPTRGQGSPAQAWGRAGVPWVASESLQITLFGPDGKRSLTRGHRDWKPVSSPRADQVTFFRSSRDGGDFSTWRTKICVVSAGGGAVRELTDGAHTDFNPTWTRDGSGRILFNRYAEHGRGTSEVFWTSPDASPGDEVRISDPRNAYEWVNGGLRDGRLFVDVIEFRLLHRAVARSFLVTLVPGGASRTQELIRPTVNMWHKLSVSPSERKVAYMLDTTGDLGDYRDDVLYVADFDPAALVVSNPVPITQPTGGRCVNEYPRWTPDERSVIFDSSCSGTSRMFLYHLTDGTTEPLSEDGDGQVMFGDFLGVPQ